MSRSNGASTQPPQKKGPDNARAAANASSSGGTVRNSARDTATFQPYYWEAYNQIVQPRIFDRYLIRRWMPSADDKGNTRIGLGPLGFAVVKILRDRCYFNPDENVLRNTCEMSMDELAKLVQCSRASLFKLFKENEALGYFVRRIEQYQIVDGKPRRDKNVYQVAMDDPVHPEDMEEYERLRAEKERERNQPAPTRMWKGRDGSNSYESTGKTHSESNASVASGYESTSETHSGESATYESTTETADTKYLPSTTETVDTTCLESIEQTAISDSLPSGGSLPLGSFTLPVPPSHKCDPQGDEERDTAEPDTDPDAIAREVRDSLLCGAWSQAIADVGQSAGAATRRMLLPHLQLAELNEDTGEAEILCPSDAIREQARKHAAALQDALSTRLARPVSVHFAVVTSAAAKETA